MSVNERGTGRVPVDRDGRFGPVVRAGGAGVAGPRPPPRERNHDVTCHRPPRRPRRRRHGQPRRRRQQSPRRRRRPRRAPDDHTTTRRRRPRRNRGAARPRSPNGTALGIYGGGGDPQTVSDFTVERGCAARVRHGLPRRHQLVDDHRSSWPYSEWAGKDFKMIWGVDMLPNSYSPNSNAEHGGRQLPRAHPRGRRRLQQ